MIKNVASQKLAVFAWDGGAGAPKTGDAAQITGQISKDGGASIATNDVNPTELDATNHPGIYVFDLTQAETNADLVAITPKSTTAGIVFKPLLTYPTTLTPTKTGYLDAAISSRAAPGVDGDTLKTLSDQLDLVALEAGGNLEAVKAQTDLFPADPASESAVEAAIAAIPAPDLSGLALEANVEGHAADALSAYDPPTRAEATADREEVLEALAAAGVSVADILQGNLADDQVFPANSLGDLIRKAFWLVANRLMVLNADGTWILYKTDGETPAATGHYTKDPVNTERSGPSWS